ncbi:MAG: ABC transporter ATP-binding protein [Ardenticatenaceae bacterium]|nr:ABC transporter ATP-binding protein [Ardenticatenaceae bacterium]MCB8989136.1 ABC transporter ATP-binding protein [Ardenticatenaceae bacterium]
MLLETRTLTKAYTPETTAVSGVSLHIAAGEIVCLLGPSGCGKTTLLRMIAGLTRPDSGTVWFEGQEITAVPPHLRDFGMMFQDFALFPHKNVFANVAFGLEMHGWSRARIAARVAEMLALVDLADFAQRDVTQLSGGEQQRVALARSLAPGPRLLMLDEPLGALDRALRERLMLDLRQILQRVGVTAVYVTHDQTEAFAIADRIVVMNGGQIEQIATPQALYARPATPFVARFLGFHNLLAGVVAAPGVVETAVGQLRIDDETPAVGTAVTLLLRPEAAAIVASGAKQEAGLQGTVTAVSFRGRYLQVWLAVAATRLMFELPITYDLHPGQTLTLALSPKSILIL